MTKTTKNAAEILKQIKELEATPRALVGADEGTHGKPLNHRIYEEITGERYATASFAGSNASRCTEESAQADTEGRIRYFPNATKEIRAAQAELKRLKTELRTAK